MILSNNHILIEYYRVNLDISQQHHSQMFTSTTFRIIIRKNTIAKNESMSIFQMFCCYSNSKLQQIYELENVWQVIELMTMITFRIEQ